MTILEAINRTNVVKPNGYSEAEKIYWLSVLDGTVKAEIIDTHENKPELKKNETTGKFDLYIFGAVSDSFTLTSNNQYKSDDNGAVYANERQLLEAAKLMKHPFKGYTDSSLVKTLIVEHPYDDIYIKWLEAQIDYANGEYGKYNNSIAMFNTAYEAYAKYYNRTHMPISKVNGYTNI
jgi:hypothetical protein